MGAWSRAGIGAQTTFGGMGGQVMANRIGRTVAFEYLVQTVFSGYNRPQVIAINQPAPGLNVHACEQVYLVQTNGTWRVMKANTNTVAYTSRQ